VGLGLFLLHLLFVLVHPLICYMQKLLLDFRDNRIDTERVFDIR
jgi:hypothetical protein